MASVSGKADPVVRRIARPMICGGAEPGVAGYFRRCRFTGPAFGAFLCRRRDCDCALPDRFSIVYLAYPLSRRLCDDRPVCPEDGLYSPPLERECHIRCSLYLVMTYVE